MGVQQKHIKRLDDDRPLRCQKCAHGMQHDLKGRFCCPLPACYYCPKQDKNL